MRLIVRAARLALAFTIFIPAALLMVIGGSTALVGAWLMGMADAVG